MKALERELAKVFDIHRVALTRRSARSGQQHPAHKSYQRFKEEIQGERARGPAVDSQNAAKALGEYQ